MTRFDARNIFRLKEIAHVELSKCFQKMDKENFCYSGSEDKGENVTFAASLTLLFN